MNKPSYLTRDGKEKLNAELKYLKGPAREELAKRLRSAIQQGDLSENADYSSTKQEQGFLEGRIEELTSILSNVIVIDEKGTKKEIVDVGAKVTIQEESYPEETYFLVGPQEADPAKGRISHISTIGLSLMGHRVGDIVEATIPAGIIKLKILKIE